MGEVLVHRWRSQKQARAVVFILHGMAEHALRYESLAQELNQAGYEVLAPDHRGHGQTGLQVGRLGSFAEKDGWHLVAQDLHQLFAETRKEYPSLPFFLIGHSMGSFLARSCLVTSPESFTGVILSGTSVQPLWLLQLSHVLSSFLILLQGPHAPSKLLNALSFGAYNQTFRPNRTAFDWLSGDDQSVDTYIQDPLCGFICSTGFFRDLFTGLQWIQQEEPLRNLPHKPPILLLSGAKDPVSHFGKDLKLLQETYHQAGFPPVDLTIYPDARHEILQETNRGTVRQDIRHWLDKHLPE